MKRLLTLCLLVLAMPLSAGSPEIEPPLVVTFSIVAIDPANGDLGVAVQADPNYGFTGAGVAVVVNDSGIDATHGDLTFGDRVVENVQALTNLSSVLTFPSGDLSRGPTQLRHLLRAWHPLRGHDRRQRSTIPG